MSRQEDIAGWLRLFVADDQVTELRALGMVDEVWAGWYRGKDAADLAAVALKLEAQARGIYFIPNPLRNPKLEIGVTEIRRHTATDDAIEARRWLLVDVDATRFGLDGKPLPDNKCPTTEAEKEAAWQVLSRSKGALEAFGLTHAVVGDSGNGWHLCYPIELPNDDASRQLCRTVLAALQDRGGDERAQIDLKTFNASRIWKLYGTRPQKGAESEGRTHRYSYVPLRPSDPITDAVRAANTTALRRAVDTWGKQDRLRGPSTPDPAAYGRKALELETGKVLTAPAGTRNNTLNASAYSLGQLVGGGALSRDAVEASLMSAATAAGLSRGEAATTIRSGIEAGLKEPRAVPDRPAQVVAQQPATAQTTAPAAPPPPPDAGISCADLMSMDLPEPRYAVSGLIPEGVTILAGRPKARKSWLMLQIALGMSTGSAVLGQIPTTPGDVLYLALEDTRRRLKKRIRKILDATNWGASARLEFRCDSGRGVFGAAQVEEWIKAHPEARMVVVDTLQKFRAPQRGGQKDGYADDYESVAAIKTVADRHAVAVVILHHSRKAGAESPFDEISGTLGLTGAADAVFLLQRDHESDTASLFVTGRDVEEETLALAWDDNGCLWTVSGRESGINRVNPDPTAEKVDRKARLNECIKWLGTILANGPARVSSIRTEATAAGFNAKLVYRARDELKVTEYPDENNKKWWQLAES